MAGLLDNYLDPAAAQRAGLFEGLTRFGAALAEAGRPRMILREGFGPGLLGGLAAGFGGFGQGMREGRQAALAQQLQDQQIAEQQDYRAAFSGDGTNLSPRAQAIRNAVPESQRAVFGLLGPQAGQQAVVAMLGKQNDPWARWRVADNGTVIGLDANGQPFVAGTTPRPPQLAGSAETGFQWVTPPTGAPMLPGAGGAAAPSVMPQGAPAMGRPAATPIAAPGQPPLAPPDMVLPAPGRGMATPIAAGGPAPAPAPAPSGNFAIPPAPQRPGETERLYRQYQALLEKPDRTPAETAVMEALRGRLGAERTVDRGPSAFDNERGKEFAAVATQIERAGRAAPNQIMRLAQIERDLERVTTGVGSQTAITVGQLAQRFGVPDSALGALGLDRATTASAENIRSLSMSLIQATLASGEFPSQNFSNADLQTLQEANPGLFNSPAGNRAIISVQRAMAERNAEIAREWTQWQRANGSNMESTQRFLNERLPEIANRDVLAPILKDFRGAPAQPINPPSVGAVQDGFRFKGGDPANPQSWERVQAPQQGRGR